MLRPTRSFLRFLVFLPLCAALPSAFAAQLGNVTVYTRIGQTLNAHIEIESLEPGEEQDLAVQLASPDAFRRAGMLRVLYQGSRSEHLEERTDLHPELTRFFVRNGVSIMPPFRKTEITDEELEALAAYLSPR
jgi:hypothetical protein